jgi:protein-S-isoprenylcysteine O-methyltransferase Ste14
MGAAGNVWMRWRVRAGYPVAIAYLLLAKPSSRSILIGSLMGLLGIAIRGWAAGHLRKHEGLATSGPYALTRNPLYFGSTILAAGFALTGNSIWAAILIAAYLLLFYPAVMHREEAELRTQYGGDFEAYASRVPLFWPRLPARTSSASVPAGFSSELYLRNREYQALIGFLLGVAVLWAKMRWLP